MKSEYMSDICYVLSIPCTDLPFDNTLTDLYEILDKLGDRWSLYYISDPIEIEGKIHFKVLTMGYRLTTVLRIKEKMNGFHMKRLNIETALICADVFGVIMDCSCL